MARSSSPERELASFVAKYAPAIAELATEARAKMRALFPDAWELVYDNYNALVIGYGPTDRSSQAVFSLAMYPRWVTLFFLQGARLTDPHGRLKGKGKQVRHIVLDSVGDLDDPAVRQLMDEAVRNADGPLAGAGGRLVVKSVSERQRPRCPG